MLPKILALTLLAASTSAIPLSNPDSSLAPLAPRVVTGSCGLHARLSASKSSQTLTVTIKDGARKPIASFTQDLAAAGPSFSVKSDLKYLVLAQVTSAGAIEFAYAGDKWSTADKGRCSVGKADGGNFLSKITGKVKMTDDLDCGFSC